MRQRKSATAASDPIHNTALEVPVESPANAWLLPATAVFLLVIVIFQARLKLIWGDELFTLYVARQPGFGGVWRALAAGADPNPPLLHFLVKLSVRAFGVGPLALRLASIGGAVLAIAAMISMLRRWVRPEFTVLGVLAFATTRGFDYSYDARSYAPLAGFSMAALALWMTARRATGRPRTAALGAMALCLVAACSCNYYGVLAFFPIASGELADVLGARRLRPGVPVSLVAAALPLLLYLPLIRHNLHEFVPHAWNRVRLGMVGLSYVELVEGMVWPVLGLAVLAIWKRRRQPPQEPLLPRAEFAAVATLLVYPILGYLVALGGAGIISPRCVLPVCCGFGLAAAVLAQRVFGGSPRGMVAALAVLVLWISVREGFCASILLHQRRAFASLSQQIAQLSDTRPMLVADSSFVLPFFFYADAATRRRIIFPVDFDAIHQYEPDDSGEQNLWAGRNGVFPFAVIPLDQVNLSQPLAVVGRPGGWLAHDLARAGVSLRPVSISGWDDVGGVFTPMAHPESQLLLTGRKQPAGGV